MQSEDHHSHARGPSAPFDYVPSSATSCGDLSFGDDRDGPLAVAVDDNPDDFYRPFVEPPYHHPDIVVDYREDAMSGGAKRKAPHLNGATAKSSASPVSAAARSSLRSASGPISSLELAKSSPSLSTAARAQPATSIKDRIRQLEHARDGGPVRGGPRGGKARAASASRPSFGSPSPAGGSRHPHGGEHGASRQRGGTNNMDRQQPLFGEVVNTDATEDDPGYGISDVTKPHTDEIDGSMHHPNPMFTRSRRHSANALSPQLEAVRVQSPEVASHSRSQSDASPTAQTFSVSPQIPNKLRRASDIGPRNGVVSPPVKAGPEPSSSRPYSPQNAAASQHKTRLSASSPPATLSPRRYSPKKSAEPSQTLNAVVRAPLPKHSPPLRSSRPRQPVSTATTSASRAKVSERYAKPGPNGASRNNPSTADNRAKTKTIPTGVDVATRRAKLQKKLQGALPKERKQLLQAEPTTSKASGSDGTPTETNHDLPVLEPTTYQPHRDVPELFLSTDNSVPPQFEPPSAETDTPHTDIDDSPSIELHNSLPSTLTQTKREDNLLKQIMEIRDGSAETTPRTQNVEDFLSERDDAETIQVVLEATPILPDANWQDPDTPSDVLSPIPDQDEEDGFFFANRSSLRPDDSVSMVFRHNYREDPEPVPPVPALPPSPETSRDGSVLGGEARSIITWVLGQYRSGLVTPDRAYDFQRQIEEIAPELPPHDAWESQAATQSYLESVLTFYASANPEAESAVQQSNEGPVGPIDVDVSPEDEEPGVAIIYGQSHTYSRDSISSVDRNFTQHSHTASNSTLRPSRLDDDAAPSSNRNQEDARPLPPRKESGAITNQYFTGSGPYRDGLESPLHPQLPEPSTGGDGLGLSIDTKQPVTPPSQHPPAPNHAPPPPPTPKFPSLAPQSQHRTPISPSVYSRDPFSPAPATSPPRNLPRPDGMPHDNNAPGKPSLDLDNEASRPASIDSSWREISNGAPVSPIHKEKEKQLKERRHLIKELVDTENSYSQDMTIMEDIYMGTASAILTETDRRVLFGNLDQVRSFSIEFLDELRQAAAAVYVIPRENRWNVKRGSIGTSHSGGADNSTINGTTSDTELHALDAETLIGQAFLKHLGRIEKVYGEWIKWNDAANQRLKELQPDHGVSLWLEECHSSAKDITHAWSLDALIIKPTQRLTKYPLLLQGLLKCTPSDHPDYLALKQAHDDLNVTIRRINDAKKRAELVDQAMNRKRKESDSKMKVGKLLNRRAERLKQQVGFSNAADDQSYEAIAQKFGGHFFQLQIVMRDIEKYLDDLQTSTNSLNNFTRSVVQYCQLESGERWPEYESNWIAFGQAMQGITNIALSTHVERVRKSVIEPILTLWKLHEGPQKMMQKRKKRLLDHVRYKAVTQRGEKPDKRLQQDEDHYNAVNETLKEELPKLYTLTKKLVEACLKNFIDLQADWMQTWKLKTAPYADNTARLPDDIGQYIASLQSTFNQDFAEWEARVKSLGICNGSTLADAQNLLSPTTTWPHDDTSSSYKARPSTVGSSRRTMSIDGEQGQHSTPLSGYRIGGNPAFSPSPLLGSFPLSDAISGSTPAVRTRASSAMSSRGPSTPQSQSAQYAPGTLNSTRPSTSSESRHVGSSSGVPRVDFETAQELEHDSNFLLDQENEPHRLHHSPEERFSGLFHSALPMSDSPPSSSPQLAEDGDARVLFLAASLFEFNIDGSRREGGYPYLRYVPGEIFDVIGQKGELWLAKNQDDPSNLFGWIWEKHFARILPDES